MSIALYYYSTTHNPYPSVTKKKTEEGRDVLFKGPGKKIRPAFRPPPTQVPSVCPFLSQRCRVQDKSNKQSISTRYKLTDGGGIEEGEGRWV
jgi:hypothetical protein